MFEELLMPLLLALRLVVIYIRCRSLAVFAASSVVGSCHTPNQRIRLKMWFLSLSILSGTSLFCGKTKANNSMRKFPMLDKEKQMRTNVRIQLL